MERSNSDLSVISPRSATARFHMIPAWHSSGANEMGPRCRGASELPSLLKQVCLIAFVRGEERVGAACLGAIQGAHATGLPDHTIS